MIRILEDWENSLEYLVDFVKSIRVLGEDFFSFTKSFSFKGFLIYYLFAAAVAAFLVVILCVQLVYAVGPFVCAGISLWRMVRLDHGDRDGTDSMANLMAAVNIFYPLVIFQGIMFGASVLTVTIGESVVSRHLKALYQLPEKWVKKAIRKYLSDISAKCRQNPLSIKGMDLVKYAVELLDSESHEDYLHGARLLSAFIEKKGEDVRSLLLPSRQKIQKLIESLRISNSVDEACLELKSRILPNRCLSVMSRLDDNTEIRELAAKILADLAGHINLAKYPESMRYISSLLQEETSQTYWNFKKVQNSQRPLGPQTIEEHFKERSKRILMQTEERRQWRLVRDQKRLTIREERRRQNREGGGSYEQILQGLTILDRLASNNHDNCRLICSAPGLLPKITAPVCSGTLIQDVTIKAWADIVTRSLKVLYQLIRAPGWTSRRLRHEISSNEQALSNLKSILNLSDEAGQELMLPAMAILTELALDLSTNLTVETIEILIRKQLQVFLAYGECEESVTMAGRSLVSLSTNSESNSALIMTTGNGIAVGCLTEILDANNNTTHRTIAAEIMENLCAHGDVEKQHIKEILLPKVLEKIMSFKIESQQRKIRADQNNSASGDEENQRYSASGDEENQRHSASRAWYGSIITKGFPSTAYPNKSSDQGSEEQEAFLSLLLVISHKLNSVDDFDDAIQNTIGREAFMDKLKSIINGYCQATADSQRIVKLCGQIVESIMRCQQYAEQLRNKGFKSSLSQASETMSRVESCMLFFGTDFGQKNTVRPLISDIEKNLVS